MRIFLGIIILLIGFVFFRVVRTILQRKRIPREIIAAGGKALSDRAFEIDGLRFEIELARSAMMDSVAGSTGVVIVCFVETGTSVVISKGTADGLGSKGLTWLKNEGSGAFIYSEFSETAESFTMEFRAAALDAIETGWKAVEIKWLGIRFWTECSSFDRALLECARRLCKLASQKILAPGKFSKLKITLRMGFEKDLPHVHWTPEQVKLVPPNFTRVCISACDSAPYLNAPLCELLRILSTGRDAYYVCRDFPIAELFPECGLVGKRLIPISTRDSFIFGLDRFTEGEVIESFISVRDSGAAISEVQRVQACELHSTVLRNLSGVETYCRRLLEFDASWYTGEYEILTTLPEAQVIEAIDAIAAKYSCDVDRIDSPFRKQGFPSPHDA